MTSDNNTVLKELNIGSIFTGRVSEIHLENMKMYPFVFLDNISKAEIAYDIVTDPSSSLPGSKSVLSYTLSFNDGVAPNTLGDGHINLKKALSVLFGQEVEVLLKDQYGQLLLKEEKKDESGS